MRDERNLNRGFVSGARSRVAHSADRAMNVAENEQARAPSGAVEREDWRAEGLCVEPGLDEGSIRTQWGNHKGSETWWTAATAGILADAFLM